MYNFVVEDGLINKYLVEYDEEKLKKLRYEIIEKCSYRVHVVDRGTRGPDEFDIYHIRNYSKKNTGEICGYTDAPDECVYEFRYDYLNHPTLVKIIDSILAGKTSFIDLLYKPNEDIIYSFYNQENSIMLEINNLSKKLENKNDIKKLIQKLTELTENLQEYQERKKLNIETEDVLKYYEEVKNCITYTCVASITLEEYYKMQDFIGLEFIDMNKALKLTKDKYKS